MVHICNTCNAPHIQIYTPKHLSCLRLISPAAYSLIGHDSSSHEELLRTSLSCLRRSSMSSSAVILHWASFRTFCKTASDFLVASKHHHGAERMVASPRWMGADHSWSSSPSAALAQSRTQRVSRSTEAVRSVASAPDGSSMSPEIAVEAAKKKVGGIEAALTTLAAVGTTEGPDVQPLFVFRKQKAVSSRTTSHARHLSKSWRGERSPSCTHPRRCSSVPTDSASRFGKAGADSADGEPAPGGTRHFGTGTPGGYREAVMGEAKIVSVAGSRWFQASDAHHGADGTSRLDSGPPVRHARCHGFWEAQSCSRN